MNIVGMVGRSDPEKGWSEFSSVSACANNGLEFWGVGVTREEALAAFGRDAECVQWKGPQRNGREWIGKMDLFVLTSRHEEMPTVVLECFAERTPICGFVPVGGMSEILQFSNGALKKVFIEERSTEKLAAIVRKVMEDADLRQRMVDDGWQILTHHFDVEKNVKDRLMKIYEDVINEKI